MFPIETTHMQLRLSIAPVAGLKDHEEIIPEKAGQMVYQLRNWVRLQNPLITDDTKEDILEFIRDSEGISSDQIVAVGDGSGRTPFMKHAGLSIAFRPEKENIATDGVLTGHHILHLLYCLGITKTEIDRYVAG